MAIPAYLWLKDDGGHPIKGSVDVQNREGSIEILSFSHGLLVPTDNNTGKITGSGSPHFLYIWDILIMLNAVKHSLAVIAAYRCRCTPPEPQIFEFLGSRIQQ